MSEERDAAVALRYDLVRIIRESLGLPESVAVPMAEHLAVGMARRFGGTYVSTRALSRAVRNEAVRRDFRGNNAEEVMRRHGISRATLYRVLAENLKTS